ADDALGVGVCLRRVDRRVDHLDAVAAEDFVEGGAELAVRVVDQKRHPLEQTGEAEVARLLCHPGTGRVSGAAREMDATTPRFDEEEHVEAAQRDRLDGEESQASMLAACWRRNCRQLGPERLGAGPRPLPSKIRLTVLGDTRRPSLSSSPAMQG